MRFRSLSLACLAVFTIAGAGCDDLQEILDAARAAHDKGGGSTSGGTGGTSAGPGAPGTPPPPAGCVTREQGGATSCKPAYTWKSYANDDCQQSGMSLADYNPYGACDDKDSTQFVSYTCCPSAYPPPPPPLPPGACNTDADCRLVVGLCTKCECTVRWTSDSLVCNAGIRLGSSAALTVAQLRRRSARPAAARWERSRRPFAKPESRAAGRPASRCRTGKRWRTATARNPGFSCKAIRAWEIAQADRST